MPSSNPRSFIDPPTGSDGDSDSSHGTARPPAAVAARAIAAAKGAIPENKDQVRSVNAAHSVDSNDASTIFADAVPVSALSEKTDAVSSEVPRTPSVHDNQSETSILFYTSERSRSDVRSDRSKILVAMAVTAVIVTSVVVTGFCLTGRCSNASPMEQTVAPTNPMTLPTPPPLAENATSVPPTDGPTNNPTAAPAQVATPVSTESPAPTTAQFRAFESTQELYAAVDEYVTAVDSASTAAAIKYGHPIGSWDVSRITNFFSLFDGEETGETTEEITGVGRNRDNPAVANAMRSFNEDLSRWNVSQATSMMSMFKSAKAFNSDISGWDVRRVTDMGGMFAWASSFNGDISSWDVGRVNNTWFMFRDADAFNGDLSNWNVSRVTNMWGMFRYADAFDGNISNWNVGRVTNMWAMFHGADSFNQNLCTWRTRLPVNCIVDDMFLLSSCPEADTPTLSNGDSMCQICAT